MEKILVTGATGALGKAVIDQLRTQLSPDQISVITRQPMKQQEWKTQGYSAFLGDYNDKGALESAMSGVDTVLLISSGDQGDRMQEHKNVIDTATKAGVKNIAYTSRVLKDRTSLRNKLMEEHFKTEDLIKSSELNYILFKNSLYMDAIPQFIGGTMALQKGIFLPAGEGRVAYALRSEMGEAMANVLLHESFEGQEYEFTGSDTYSFYDVAEVLSILSGKRVEYHPVENEVFIEAMKQRKLTEQLIQKILAFILDIKANQEAQVFSDLEVKLGRKPTVLSAGLKQLFAM